MVKQWETMHTVDVRSQNIKSLTNKWNSLTKLRSAHFATNNNVFSCTHTHTNSLSLSPIRPLSPSIFVFVVITIVFVVVFFSVSVCIFFGSCFDGVCVCHSTLYCCFHYKIKAYQNQMNLSRPIRWWEFHANTFSQIRTMFVIQHHCQVVKKYQCRNAFFCLHVCY